jgi:hypothetical protein
MRVIAVTTNVKGALAKLEKVQAAIPASVVREMALAVKVVEADLRSRSFSARQRRNSFLGALGANPPGVAVRSGHTRRSLNSEVVIKSEAPLHITGVVGSALKHVRMLEFGGVIKGRPFLSIPLAASQTPTGQDRYAGRKIPGAFIWPSKKQKRGSLKRIKNLYVVRPGTGGGLEFMRILLRSVRIRPHMMFASSTARVRSKVERMFHDGVRVAIRQAVP